MKKEAQKCTTNYMEKRKASKKYANIYMYVYTCVFCVTPWKQNCILEYDTIAQKDATLSYIAHINPLILHWNMHFLSTL